MHLKYNTSTSMHSQIKSNQQISILLAGNCMREYLKDSELNRRILKYRVEQAKVGNYLLYDIYIYINIWDVLRKSIYWKIAIFNAN